MVSTIALDPHRTLHLEAVRLRGDLLPIEDFGLVEDDNSLRLIKQPFLFCFWILDLFAAETLVFTGYAAVA